MPTAQRSMQEAADHLACDWGACRVSFTWMGTRKALTKEQKETTAECFGASPKWVSGSNRLWNTANSAYRAVTKVRREIREYWEGHTLPYVEDGIRLIRHDRMEPFDAAMQGFRRDLHTAVYDLNRAMYELIQEARNLLGETFDRANYPATFEGKFDVEWDFPSLAPPEYLATLNPRLFAEHSARIAARFEEVARRTEEAFVGELAGLIDALQAKLAGEQDGKAKRLHEANIEQVREFFERFRRLNLHSSEQLDHLVDQAERAMTSDSLFGDVVTADQVRDSSASPTVGQMLVASKPATPKPHRCHRRRSRFPVRLRPVPQPEPNVGGWLLVIFLALIACGFMGDCQRKAHFARAAQAVRGAR